MDENVVPNWMFNKFDHEEEKEEKEEIGFPEPVLPQLIDREPREGLLTGIDEESAKFHLKQPLGPPSFQLHNGLLAVTNRERVLPIIQENIAEKQAKTNLPPNRYAFVLAQNNQHNSYWVRVHGSLIELNDESDRFLQQNSIVVNQCIQRFDECQDAIEGQQIVDNETALHWSEFLIEWAELLKDLIERAQSLHQLIGTNLTDLMYRPIEHNQEMVLTQFFSIEIFHRLNGFISLLNNL
jgi:hypothetical protein